MARPLGSTPKCVLSRGERLDEMEQGSSLSDIAFFGAEIVDVVFHEPLANACRKVARFSGKILAEVVSLYDAVHKPQVIGSIAIQTEKASVSSEPH